MQVVAFSTGKTGVWRWRIVGYSGDAIEESHEAYSTIAAAVAHGTRRLEQMNASDRASSTLAAPTVSISRRKAR